MKTVAIIIDVYSSFFFHKNLMQVFSYSFKYPIIILAVLVIDTLLFSVCLEWMKNVSGYNKAVSIICSRCLHGKGG